MTVKGYGMGATTPGSVQQKNAISHARRSAPALTSSPIINNPAATSDRELNGIMPVHFLILEAHPWGQKFHRESQATTQLRLHV